MVETKRRRQRAVKVMGRHLEIFTKSFAAEIDNLVAFCQAWNTQLARGARDPFSWIQELTPAEGLVPFAMAVLSHNHGGAFGRSLERYGSWQPELTEDVLTSLDHSSPNSVFIDIGAGLGWFYFTAAASNHSVLALETDNLNIAALRRSACANYYYQNSDRFILLGSGSSSGSGITSVEGVLLRVAPRIIEALTTSSTLSPQDGGGGGEMQPEEEEEEARSSVVLVHPATAREALEVMAAGVSGLWPEIKPRVIAMVLPTEKENNKKPVTATATLDFDSKETEEIASLVFHRMHALEYNVKMDSTSNMAQSPAAFASLATMLARNKNGNSPTVVWFTRDLERSS